MVHQFSPNRCSPLVLCVLTVLAWSWGPAMAGRSCTETRQVYGEKGYSLSTAPLTQISGKTQANYREEPRVFDTVAMCHSTTGLKL